MAVVTLTIGIGSATAMYTVLKRVVIDPLPYPSADRLIRLKNAVPGSPDGEWNMAAVQYFYLRENAASIERIGAFNAGELSVETPSGAESAMVAMASYGMMDLVGARPALGRSITEADESPGSEPVVVLSDGFWQSRFGRSPDVIGQTVVLFGVPMEVVGVLEPGADLPQEPGAARPEPVDLWVPLGSIDTRFNPEGPFYSNHTTPMIARLAPGVSVEAAQAELDRLTGRLPDAYPEVYSEDFFQRYGFRTVAYPLKSHVVGSAAEAVWIMVGIALLVLLVACVNVANLLLVRLDGRSRELAVRSAMGAGRAAIARQLFAEALVLAAAAGGLALLVGAWATRGLVALAPDTFPRLREVAVGYDVVLGGIGLTFLVATLVAAVPIGRAGRSDLQAELADGGRSGTAGPTKQRFRSALLVAQVAMALILTIGAALLVESFLKLRSVDPGVRAEGVIAVPLQLNFQDYADIPAMWRFYDAVLEEVRHIPGVTAAGMSQTLPFTGGFGCTVQGFADAAVHQRISETGSTTCAGQVPTTPGYFESIGIPLRRGRLFTEDDNDRPSTGAVIVSEAFAERFWPGDDPIGKGVAPSGRRSGPFYRVVGVVGDVFSSSPVEEPAAVVYYPVVRIPETSGWTPTQMELVVRTEADDPLELVPQIRSIVQRLDPSVPVDNAIEVRSLVRRSMSILTFSTTLLGVAATIAILLAAVGLYGTMAYIVSRRTGEIGIRMAVGASARDVEALVLGGSLKSVLLGLAAGVGAAAFATRLLRGLLYGVEPADVTAYAAGSLLLLAVGLIATYLPARRAAHVDPIVALRSD